MRNQSKFEQDKEILNRSIVPQVTETLESYSDNTPVFTYQAHNPIEIVNRIVGKFKERG